MHCRPSLNQIQFFRCFWEKMERRRKKILNWNDPNNEKNKYKKLRLHCSLALMCVYIWQNIKRIKSIHTSTKKIRANRQSYVFVYWIRWQNIYKKRNWAMDILVRDMRMWNIYGKAASSWEKNHITHIKRQIIISNGIFHHYASEWTCALTIKNNSIQHAGGKSI